MPLVWINRLLVAVGLAFFGAMLFHALALFWPGISEPMPWSTHATFVAINLFFGVAFVRRVRWLAAPFALLTLQQLWSHGGELLRGREAHPPFWDPQSLFALGGLGLIWLLLRARGRA